jgi:hypothetical protein
METEERETGRTEAGEEGLMFMCEALEVPLWTGGAIRIPINIKPEDRPIRESVTFERMALHILEGCIEATVTDGKTVWSKKRKPVLRAVKR